MDEMHAQTQPSTGAEELPLNRLSNQLVSAAHHTLKTKFFSIVMQIFGAYGSFNKATTSISHCTLFNEDIYRLHIITWDDLDFLKLINPFKWIEFLIVMPLEMFVFSLGYLTRKILLKLPSSFLNCNSIIIQGLLLIPVTFLLIVLEVIFFLNPLLDLSVNIITGIVRRCGLAPARYIVRPAIEMAMSYPKTFFFMVASVAIGTAFIIAMILAGTLPAAIAGSFFLSCTLAEKFAVVGVMAIWLGSALTKGFHTLIDLINLNAPPFPCDQKIALLKRDQQYDYDFTLIKVKEKPTLEMLSNTKYAQTVPLFILHENQWLYMQGLSAKKEKIFSYLGKHIHVSEGTELSKSGCDEATQNILYHKVYYAGKKWGEERGHVNLRTGHTDKITEMHHGVNVKRTEVRERGTYNKDWMFRLAHFLGGERILFPIEKKAKLSSGVSSAAAQSHSSSGAATFNRAS